jgi:hypothetical protein
MPLRYRITSTLGSTTLRRGFAWTWLGALAVRTRRARIATAVTCPLFHYHPGLVAQAAATVSRLSGGRFALGVGTGEGINERPLGWEFPGYKERAARMVEAIEIMRRLLSGEKVDFQGTYRERRKRKPPFLLHSPASRHPGPPRQPGAPTLARDPGGRPAPAGGLRRPTPESRTPPGEASLRSWSCLPITSGPTEVVPVTFPPGLARLLTNPLPTGSPTASMTIGIVFVAFRAARAAGVAEAAMTSTFRRTKSVARLGSRSTIPSADRWSMMRFCPSTYPSARSPCRKASRRVGNELTSKYPTRAVLTAGRRQLAT